MHYNFARIHSSLRVTPAMAAGVTDHVWEIGEIVNLLGALAKLIEDTSQLILKGLPTHRKKVRLHAHHIRKSLGRNKTLPPSAA